jgi:hypothetical protein
VSEAFSIFICPIALANFLTLKFAHKRREHAKGRGQAGVGATKRRERASRCVAVRSMTG